MHRFLLHNGEIREATEHLVSLGQVGLLSGWGVFSTIRIYDGVLFAWERHWSRMEGDARLLRVPFPDSPEELKEDLDRLVEANQAWNGTMRVVIVRNRGGLWEGPGITRAFDVVGLTANVYPWHQNLLGGTGVKLGIIPQARHAANEFAGTKVLSWAQNLAWYERAHEEGFDEVILLNERGEISECTSGNIFAVYGKDVFTPPLTSGCLAGITRAVLLEEIRDTGFEFRQKPLFPADLEAADEVFITSTTRELLPVVSIAGLKVRRSQIAVDCLERAFAGYVQAYVAAHPACDRVATS
jgi:branched-chain amino acid aminotransferase